MTEQAAFPWQIRPMRPDDNSAILAMARTLVAWFQPLDQMTLAIDLGQHEGIVVESEGEIVAFLTFCVGQQGRAELSWLAVTPSAQRYGVGTHLLATLEEELRTRGVEWLELHTVPADHDPAFEATAAFYRRHGFEIRARIEDFYAQGRPGLRLVKQLRSGVPS